MLRPGSTDIIEVTLNDYIDHMYNDFTVFIIGGQGAGKTELGKTLAAMFAIGKGKQYFGNAKSIDPYGSVTKTGKMSSIGCFLFNDAPLRTLMSSILTQENIKSLFDVRESSAVPARYGDAIFPRRIPRIFTANTGDASDPGAYFDEYGHTQVGAFARRDQAAVRNFNADILATLRRMIVFTPTREEIGFASQTLEDSAVVDYAAERQLREQYFSNSS